MKAKAKRARVKTKQGKASPTGAPPAFTDEEEAFFQAGMASIESVHVESFSDLDAGYERRPSFLRRLLFRTQTT